MSQIWCNTLKNIYGCTHIYSFLLLFVLLLRRRRSLLLPACLRLAGWLADENGWKFLCCMRAFIQRYTHRVSLYAYVRRAECKHWGWQLLNMIWSRRIWITYFKYGRAAVSSAAAAARYVVVILYEDRQNIVLLDARICDKTLFISFFVALNQSSFCVYLWCLWFI